MTQFPLQIPTPSPLTIYLLIFLSPSLPTLSGLCSILASHKIAFETAPLAARPSITTFNGFLMDICNLLWRSRAFNLTDTNALGCLLPSTILPALTAYITSLSPTYALPTFFSLSNNPSLAALSIAAFRDLEDRHQSWIRTRHAGPVGQKTLGALAEAGGVRVDWKEYRLCVLAWLAERGVAGVRELMGCTMKGLMGKGESGLGGP